MMPKQSILAAAILLMCASACTPRQTSPNVNLGGYPPAFRDGYVDGCNSARSATAKVRDEARFTTDTMYASGWRDGHDICARPKR